MYQAKLLQLNELIEEEVLIEINGIQFVGFATICPYNLELNKIYPVNLSLTFLDDSEIVELSEPQQHLKRIDSTYKYLLYGQVSGDSIDIGNGIKIQDDIFSEYSYLDKKYIVIQANRLSVEFI